MKLFSLKRWIGCNFGHAGKWGKPQQEGWVSYNLHGTEKKYYKTVQFRTCTECDAVEKREVCSGR